MARKNWTWLILFIVFIIGFSSFILFIFNRNTPVPASWGNPAGARMNLISWFNAFMQALLLPSITVVLGILIVQRYPRHRVGWLLVAVALASTLDAFFREWAVYGYFTANTPHLGQEWAAWVSNWSWIVIYSLLIYMVAIFPTGHFLSQRWGWVILAMLAWFFLPLMTAAVIESQMTSAFQIANPLNITYPPPLYDWLFYLGVPSMLVVVITLFGSVLVRYRQGSGRERQQMKWLFAGVALMAIMIVGGFALTFGAGITLGDILVNASMMGPILGIGVALLRYRLYDIDVIIRKTLVYGALTAVLVLVYFGTVLLLQAAFSRLTSEQSPVVIVISTLLIAALFTPLRGRMQTLIDRRFYRQKYNAEQVLARFAQTARDEVELEKLAAELMRVSAETMQPDHISLWLKPDKERK